MSGREANAPTPEQLKEFAKQQKARGPGFSNVIRAFRRVGLLPGKASTSVSKPRAQGQAVSRPKSPLRKSTANTRTPRAAGLGSTRSLLG